jgi:glucose/arabinose dehydrogenase
MHSLAVITVVRNIGHMVQSARKYKLHGRELEVKAKYRWIALLAVLLVGIGAATWILRARRPAADQALPTPGVPLASIALPPPDQASTRLKVPAGFAVRIFAKGLAKPRLMAIGADGQLYVAERGANQVTRLPDANHDGLADSNDVIAKNLKGPHSLEWHDGALYVTEKDRVTRLLDKNGNGNFLDPGEQNTIIKGLPSDGIHPTPTLHFGPDGKLYVALGSTCNACAEADKRNAAILRFNPDGSIPADNPFANDADPNRRPVWAEGLRNSIDFVFMPDGQLWADHNGVDLLGNDLPPEEVVIDIQKGKHYGWPYCYTPTNGVTPAGAKEVRDTTNNIGFAPPIGSCDQATPALYTDLAHQAPLGMAYYDKALFPAEYQGNLFIAYHGSWNAETTPRDCKVQMIVVENGKPTRGQTFLTGFRDNPNQQCADGWGRPADVAVGPQGELFVSDDKNGNIYRIVYVGT